MTFILNQNYSHFHIYAINLTTIRIINLDINQIFSYNLIKILNYIINIIFLKDLNLYSKQDYGYFQYINYIIYMDSYSLNFHYFFQIQLHFFKVLEMIPLYNYFKIIRLYVDYFNQFDSLYFINLIYINSSLNIYFLFQFHNLIFG